MKTIILLLTVVVLTTILYGQTKSQTAKLDFSKVKIKGYINTVEVGGVFGVGQVRNFHAGREQFQTENSFKLFSFQDISSFKLNTKTAIGFGLGVEIGVQHYGDAVRLNFPIFADFRYRPITKRVSPIFIEQVGLSLLPIYNGGKGELRTGALLNSKVGLNTIIDNRTSLTLGIGYRFQHYSYRGLGFPDNIPEHISVAGQRATVHDLYHFLTCFISVQF